MQNSTDWSKKYYSDEAKAKVEERKALWNTGAPDATRASGAACVDAGGGGHVPLSSIV